MRNKTFGQLLSFLFKLGFLSSIALVISVSLFTLANYSDAVERLVFNIKIRDSVRTNDELMNLHYFYEMSRKWRVQWLADKYFFNDAYFYGVADIYLTKNWDKVINDLQDRQDDPRSYPYGNARFKQARDQYQAGQTAEALNLVLKEVSADFERDLRNCLNSSSSYNQCFDRVWNYDLATNKKDAEEALKNPEPQPDFILGPIPKKGPPLIPKKNEKNGPGDGKEEGGQGGPRKRP